MLETSIQLFINGISLGCAYALITLGFVLVINAIGAVNFAQGDLVMASGFLTVVLAEFIVTDSASSPERIGINYFTTRAYKHGRFWHFILNNYL